MNRGGDAVSAYERAGELNPSFAKAFTRVGVIWRLARNYNQALTSFQKAVAIDPNFPPAYREMAELYFYTGQFDVASQTYQKYLDLADKDDYTQFRYAQYLFLTKDYEGALRILNPLRDKMDQPIMWRLSAYSNYEMGNHQVGMEQINTFFQKSQSTRILSSDYEYLGKLMAKSGQDSLAMMNFEKAIEMDSSKISLYNEIGSNLFQQKKYHEAALAYKKKVDAAPKDATLQDFFNVGKSYYFSKEFQLADSAFTSMIQLNQQWPIGYIWRARVMTNVDDSTAVKGLAAPYYQTVIEKSMVDTVKYVKELIEAYKYLGDINALKENYGASLYYYDKFMRLDSANTEVPKTIESVKALYKNTSSSVITLEKDSQGLYLIPGFINNTSVSFTFNPLVSGISIDQEGATQLLGNANGGAIHTVDQIKIGNRSLKNPDVSMVANLPAPVIIGADALNKLNIVVNFINGTLLLR
ncbi:MAG: tetratricopeptide repeat protein [Chitinophagales bacterium]|nr:tetratricopeptide repeat protein [Chitinophagales bacterium]